MTATFSYVSEQLLIGFLCHKYCNKNLYKRCFLKCKVLHFKAYTAVLNKQLRKDGRNPSVCVCVTLRSVHVQSESLKASATAMDMARSR